MRYFKIILGTLAVILLVVFILQNDDLHRPVKLNFGLSVFTGGPVEANKAETASPGATADPGNSPAGAGVEEGVEIPVFILVFLAFFLGLLVASLYSLSEKYRLKRVVKAGASRIKELEAEITSLRNMPLTQSMNGSLTDKAETLPAPASAPEKAEAEGD